MKRGFRSGKKAGFVAIAVLTMAFAGGCAKKAPPPKKPAAPVAVATVIQKTVPVQIKAIGNVEAYSTVGVKSQIGGELSVANLKPGVGPLTVNHLGQLPSVTISFNVKPGVALGEAAKIVKDVARATLPPTVSAGFQGSAQAFQASTQGLWILLIMALLVIYIVLGILYESFIHPLTILSGLPAAMFGALITLIVFRKDLNIYAFVGVIMLLGIVKKNAIMMIDFALEAQRNQGKSPVDAIYEGAVIRFRPIMMTTMAALMGTLPIAIGFGAGAESRRPLGLAVVGGLVVSQLLTLYITPVVYCYMDKFQQKAGAWIGTRKKMQSESVAQLR